MTDTQLRELIHNSPETGHRELYNRYFNYVYAIVFHTLRNCASLEDVEECVADTFVDVIAHLKNVRDGSFKAYIGTTAKRKALNVCRSIQVKRKHSVPIESIEEIPSQQHVEEDAENTLLRKVLLEKIKELGEPDSSIIIQKYYYNRKSAEIAAITGLTPATVRKRCGRAIKRLKQELSQFELIW